METKEKDFTKKKEFLQKKSKDCSVFDYENIICSIIQNNMEYIFKNKNLFSYKDKEKFKAQAAIIWGEQPLKENVEIVNYAYEFNLPLFIAENGFLRSAYCWDDGKTKKKYSDGISFITDSIPYFDAINTSKIENDLENKNLIITQEQRKRAKNCINKIVSNHLTKYNHQPIFEPEIGRKEREKILVIDQAYRDMSITKGLANDSTFENMLNCAIKENPDADIIIKTHPDIIQGTRLGYYQNIKSSDNIYILKEAMNPISLIQYCTKIYVCTSQFGFEALMCGKDVEIFGLPFYAGWGLANCRQNSKKRTNKRTLEEIFYIAYIKHTHYVNPDKKCECEIEEAIDYLINLRNEFQKDEIAKRKKKEAALNNLCNYINNAKHTLAFWGASLFLEDFLKKYNIKNKNILGIIDKDISKQGKKLKEFNIFPPDILNNGKIEEIIFTIKNKNETIYPEIKNYLNKNYSDIKICDNFFSKE